MVRVFIVDDEPPARARMMQLCREVPDVLIVGEAADALDARAAIVAARPDVVFLDIEMPQLSGTELARSLAEPRPFIVFTTAFDRYALDAFAVEATDYLVKPITRPRLAATLSRVRERLSRRSDFERDLAAASAAQAALLPRSMPHIDGYDAAALTLPARGVGGDFFVAQPLKHDRVVLALGDVAGKGVPAGLVASSLQARLEAVARHATATPAEVVADVNRTLCATSDGARFATLVYLEIDVARAEFTLVNAGHLPVLLLQAGEAPQRFASLGPALGLLPDALFPSTRFTMPAHATLVMYSDGVTEALNAAGEEYGEPQLIRDVIHHADAAALTVCQALLDAARQFGAGTAADDMTVLALRRGALPKTNGSTDADFARRR